MTTPLPPTGTPRDRRSRRRILTKRNLLSVAGVVLLVFIVVSVIGEFRSSSGEGTFGRLYDSRGPNAEPAVPIREQIEPLAISEGAHDPLLSEAVKREQLLGITEYVTPMPEPYDEPQIIATTPARPLETGIPPEERERRPSRFVISGGSNGVQVTSRPDSE
jgi:hypothetical protein